METKFDWYVISAKNKKTINKVKSLGIKCSTNDCYSWNPNLAKWVTFKAPRDNSMVSKEIQKMILNSIGTNGTKDIIFNCHGFTFTKVNKDYVYIRIINYLLNNGPTRKDDIIRDVLGVENRPGYFSALFASLRLAYLIEYDEKYKFWTIGPNAKKFLKREGLI